MESPTEPAVVVVEGVENDNTNNGENRKSSYENENSNDNKNERKPQRKKRHGARNQNRHKLFVKWLMDNFSLDDSASNNNNNNNHQHVLDVAGGKGEVSARLTMCHLQNVVMIDPRPADICHCYETLVLPKIPNKWQRRLEEQRANNPNFINEVIDSRFRQLVTTFDDHSLATSLELQQAVQNASVILGLHADGATEAIVDAALQYKKGFVVVPCCVFPNLFTTRRVKEEQNGGQKMVPVRSHEQFCRYLAAKDPRIKIEELPFEGRNTAIWWNGK